ncbi:MAG: type II toxin-antitoxin system RelE/ParE family toxin [Spirosomataceae bacterium]
MAYKINWTKTALEEFHKITDYIAEVRSEKSAQVFVKKAYDMSILLKEFPEIGIESTKKQGIRSVIIQKNFRMFYTFQNQIITIIGVVDVRRKKNRFQL